MSGAKVSSIASSLGKIQHLRQQPADTRIPASPAAAYPTPGYPDTRIPAPRLVKADVGKRSNPDYAQVKAYVLKSTKKDAMGKALDRGYEDFSALVQELLDDYLMR